jgi:hypothetical protein
MKKSAAVLLSLVACVSVAAGAAWVSGLFAISANPASVRQQLPLPRRQAAVGTRTSSTYLLGAATDERSKLEKAAGARLVGDVASAYSSIGATGTMPTSVNGHSIQAILTQPDVTSGAVDAGVAVDYGGGFVAKDLTDSRYAGSTRATAQLDDMERMLNPAGIKVARRMSIGSQEVLVWSRGMYTTASAEPTAVPATGRAIAEAENSAIWWVVNGRLKLVYGPSDSYQALLPAAREMGLSIEK